MAGKKTGSMQDIADELGISKVTVSKALNGKDGVGEELKQKIFQSAQEHGYILPDYGQRRAKKVGIVMSDRFNSGDAGKFYMGMYEKIIAELRKVMCASMMITPTRESLQSDLDMLERKGTVDGLILLGILDRKVRDAVDAIPLPKVYVDVYDVTHKSDSVVTENIYSAYELTDYLIQKGHKDIGFVGTVGGTTSITDRYLGFMRGILETGRAPNQEWVIPDRNEDGAAIELMLPERLPTAFVCNCDETAFRLVKTLKAKGIRVPEDISVVGFDDDIYAELCEPALTTVAVNIEEIGKVAAKRMMRYMERTRRRPGEVFRILGKIIYRDSVKEIKE